MYLGATLIVDGAAVELREHPALHQALFAALLLAVGDVQAQLSSQARYPVAQRVIEGCDDLEHAQSAGPSFNKTCPDLHSPPSRPFAATR